MAEEVKYKKVRWIRNNYVGILKESLAEIHLKRGEIEILGAVSKEEKIKGLKETRTLAGERVESSNKPLTGAEGDGKVTDSVPLGKKKEK